MMDVINFIIVLCLVIIVIEYIKDNLHLWKLASRLPGPRAYPIIGNALFFLGNVPEVTTKLKKLMEKYERMTRIWIGNGLITVIYDSKDIEILLKETKDIEKADEYKFYIPVVGHSIFSSPAGPRYKRNKKMILPSFQLNNLKTYFSSFNKHCTDLIETLKKETGHQIDIGRYLTNRMTNILLETVLGYDNEDMHEKSLEIIELLNSAVKISLERIFKLWLRPDVFFKLSNKSKEQERNVKTLHNFLDMVIKKRQEIRKKNPGLKCSNIIDCLIEARDDNDNSCLTKKEIMDEIMTFLFAGQDTTSLSVGYTLCLLGLYKNEQEKLYNEIISKKNNSDDYIDYEQLKNMDYLNRVIKESWRLFPPSPVFGKKLLKDVELDDGYVLPKDSSVAIITYFLHRSKKYFDNPEIFNPDNFLPEKEKGRHPYSYLPFSAGYRNCIGQLYAQLLVRVVVARIIKIFKIHSEIPHENFILAFETTMQRDDGFLLTLELRDTK